MTLRGDPPAGGGLTPRGLRPPPPGIRWARTGSVGNVRVRPQPGGSCRPGRGPPVSNTTLEPHRPVTVRMARWSATHPWRAIALWLVFVTACVYAGGAIGTREMSDEQAG